MTEALHKAIDVIVKAVNPDKIILFGSQANGSSNQNSDYDLLVLKKGIKKRRKLTQLIYSKFNNIGAPIDVIVNELNEYEELKHNPFLIYYSISQEGKVVYEK